LLSRTYSIPLYWLWAFIFRLPSKSEISKATSELIGMSNSMHDGLGVPQLAQSIAENLRLQIVLYHFKAK
jgi:hypothetical protein